MRPPEESRTDTLFTCSTLFRTTLSGFRETRGWAAGRKRFSAMRFSARLKDHAFIDRDQAVPYKGFQAPGRGSDALAEKLGKALEARLDFGRLQDRKSTRLNSSH